LGLAIPRLVARSKRTGCVGPVTAQSYSHLLLPVGLSDGHSLLQDELKYLTEAAATTIYHMPGITPLLEICDIRGLNYIVKLMDSIFGKFCDYSVNFYDAHVEIWLC